MMKSLFLALFLALFLPFAFASQLYIESPVQQTLYSSDDSRSAGADNVLDLGVIGPGQTVEIIASRGSGAQAKDSLSGGEALWDQLFEERGSLPRGWKADDSKLFEKPFHAFVTASRDASDGVYTFQVKAFDQYEGAGERVFQAKVSVSKDVMEQEVSPVVYKTGVGLPAVFQIKLRNKSSASDVFELNASGVPGGWKETRRVFVKFQSTEIVDYEVLPAEQGEFGISLSSTSLSSPLMSRSNGVSLQAYSSLEQDLKALNKGILLFPTVEQASYSLLGLLAKLFLK